MNAVTCTIKVLTIVIYDRNDIGLYYKTTIVANLTMIIANLALARSIDYDRKVCCKLKRTFTIVNYNPKPSIVQATAQLNTVNNFTLVILLFYEFGLIVFEPIIPYSLAYYARKTLRTIIYT